MKFNLFSYLNYAISKPMDETRAKRFYDNHSNYLSQYIETHKYLEARSSFEINSANIVIKSLMNMRYVENKARLAARTGADESTIDTERLPFLMDDGQRILVPFFSRAINDKFSDSPLSLTAMPYKTLRTRKSFSFFYEDPIEKYGYRIFDSEFTQMVPLAKSPMGDSQAFLDMEIDTIYVISDQGTLETSIPFFDEGMKCFDRNNLIDRVCQLMERYYSFNKIGFIDGLHELGLISKKLYEYIKKEEIKAEKKEREEVERIDVEDE